MPSKYKVSDTLFCSDKDLCVRSRGKKGLDHSPFCRCICNVIIALKMCREANGWCCPTCPSSFLKQLEKREIEEEFFKKAGAPRPSLGTERPSSGGVGLAPIREERASAVTDPPARLHPDFFSHSVIRLALWPVCRLAPISRKDRSPEARHRACRRRARPPSAQPISVFLNHSCVQSFFISTDIKRGQLFTGLFCLYRCHTQVKNLAAISSALKTRVVALDAIGTTTI